MNRTTKTRTFAAIRSYAGWALAFFAPDIGAAAAESPSVPSSEEVRSAADALENTESPDETIVLSPFVVDASQDTGYQAASTLAGTRIRTNLTDVAASIQVVTKEMLQDTGSRNSADLLVYTTNTEVGGIGGNFSATYTTGEGYTVESGNFRRTGQPGARTRGA
jgi:outer membrane receptor protein involved in Fe transport